MRTDEADAERALEAIDGAYAVHGTSRARCAGGGVMGWAPSSAIVLSFARGRARRVARELVDLEFRLDVEQLTGSGALRLLRPQREALRREIDRRVRTLAALAADLDPRDALRSTIEHACRCYRARGILSIEGSHDPEIDWALALRALELATARR